VREDGRIVGGEVWQEKVHNSEEWKKLLRTARNRHILHMTKEWVNGITKLWVALTRSDDKIDPCDCYMNFFPRTFITYKMEMVDDTGLYVTSLLTRGVSAVFNEPFPYQLYYILLNSQPEHFHSFQ
jgi:hypothetical protein